MADHSNENSNDSCIKKVGHADMIRRESEESVNAPIAATSEASWSYKFVIWRVRYVYFAQNEHRQWGNEWAIDEEHGREVRASRRYVEDRCLTSEQALVIFIVICIRSS